MKIVQAFLHNSMLNQETPQAYVSKGGYIMEQVPDNCIIKTEKHCLKQHNFVIMKEYSWNSCLSWHIAYFK